MGLMVLELKANVKFSDCFINLASFFVYLNVKPTRAQFYKAVK